MAKLSMDAFRRSQEEALNSWHTGKAVNFEEAVKYHKSKPEHMVFTKKLAKAKAEGITLIQPRAGVALLDEHLELLTYLQNEGQADLLPSTIDSYTRHNRYSEAQHGIEESLRSGKSMLNGFPAVNHGVDACRHIIDSLNVPVQVRHGTPDARLLAEITFAGGFTSFEGGGISYNVPYCKNIPMEETIRKWKYVDRLVGLYEEAGVSIDREPYGPLTGTLVPPCISHAVAVLEALLAAEQGVKNITVGYGQCGNIYQDVGAIAALKEITEEYLKKYGYDDVNVYTVFHQWMGGFPQDEAQAYGVISWGAAVAVLAGATKVIVKTPHEAFGIPTMQANAAGLRTTKQLCNMLSCQVMKNGPRAMAEKEMILKETRAILDKALELGGDDFEMATVAGFEAGVLDVPFAPSSANKGLAMPARDNEGAVRFLEFGNLPFNEEIKAFHKQKMQERSVFEKRPANFNMVIDDIYAISAGKLVGRPE
ncbi:MAG: methylaspartate mutase subunit E [Clostridia bacterium]|nr:methylaspartate mutase subunit E [Oscillospiraceae bacterium]MBQ6934586.1 methylaspartate mutase subunit E [Clostridia bacterium]